MTQQWYKIPKQQQNNKRKYHENRIRQQIAKYNKLSEKKKHQMQVQVQGTAAKTTQQTQLKTTTTMENKNKNKDNK